MGMKHAKPYDRREINMGPGDRVLWTRPRVLTDRGTGQAIEIFWGRICVKLDSGAWCWAYPEGLQVLA